MYRFLMALLAISCFFSDGEGCAGSGTRANEDDEIENLEWVEYDLTDTSSDDNNFDGGIYTDNKKTPNDELSCKPNIELCSKVDGEPVCNKGRVWIRLNFNKDAESWKIITPYYGSHDKINCNFVVYEHRRFSKQGRKKLIKPGTTVEINWNIRSLKYSK